VGSFSVNKWETSSAIRTIGIRLSTQGGGEEKFELLLLKAKGKEHASQSNG